jgi:hypothetical protein
MSLPMDTARGYETHDVVRLSANFSRGTSTRGARGNLLRTRMLGNARVIDALEAGQVPTFSRTPIRSRFLLRSTGVARTPRSRSRDVAILGRLGQSAEQFAQRRRIGISRHIGVLSGPPRIAPLAPWRGAAPRSCSLRM